MRTIIVSPNVTGIPLPGPITIAEALQSAEDGDVIRLKDGVYVENIQIDKSIIITGSGSSNVFVQGTISITRGEVRISDLTVEGSSGTGVIASRGSTMAS